MPPTIPPTMPPTIKASFKFLQLTHAASSFPCLPLLHIHFLHSPTPIPPHAPSGHCGGHRIIHTHKRHDGPDPLWPPRIHNRPSCAHAHPRGNRHVQPLIVAIVRCKPVRQPDGAAEQAAQRLRLCGQGCRED